MTVSAVFFTVPNAVVTHESGRAYKAASTGLLTVSYPDGANTGGIGAILPQLYLTGTTTDRLTLNPGASNPWPPGDPCLAFLDTTLTDWCFWVGFGLSSTGWADYLGSAV